MLGSLCTRVIIGTLSSKLWGVDSNQTNSSPIPQVERIAIIDAADLIQFSTAWSTRSRIGDEWG
ncbi:MAG: hypothetical protein LC541_14200 [Candidatus Thiodiazotropha sp.]|nr:hypothetical protein [Candidatus Thiodiazotropha sp.]MCM8884424.1 hypothetical protein [Candidatus Thiodiazotropha sp.]